MSEKINRNQICPCGSGKKYKKCCHQTGGFSLLTKSFTVSPSSITSAAKIAPAVLRNIFNLGKLPTIDGEIPAKPDSNRAEGEKLPDNARVD